MNSSFEADQIAMLEQLSIPPDHVKLALGHTAKIITLDVQYAGEWGYVALDVIEHGGGSHTLLVCKAAVTTAYEPGYFAFREGPLLEEALQKAFEYLGEKPALLIIDGHGTAHPRKMGLASWLGVRLDLPTIGVAKRPLLKVDFNLSENAGAECQIVQSGERVGTVLRTQTGIKPIFISAGHKISQAQSVEVISSLIGKYRLIEPIRRADQAARAFAKGIRPDGVVVLN